MTWRPQRSTRTDTSFPDTTRFRSFPPTFTRDPPIKGKHPGTVVTSVIMSNSQNEVGMPTFGGLSQKQNGLLLPESKSSWPSEMSSVEPKSLIGNKIGRAHV